MSQLKECERFSRGWHVGSKSLDVFANDVFSLFTEINVEDAIDYLTKWIHTYNKLPKLGNKLLFNRALCHFPNKTRHETPFIGNHVYKISSIWRTVFIYPHGNLVSKTLGFYSLIYYFLINGSYSSISFSFCVVIKNTAWGLRERNTQKL